MKFINLGAPIILLIMIMSFTAFSDYQREAYISLEERHLDVAVNYCVDAAVEVMKEDSSDLGLDYQWFESVNADPSRALDMYKILMCKNLRYNVSEQNLKYIEEVTPIFVVAVYDGYYLGRERPVTTKDIDNTANPTKEVGTQYGLVFNPKMPYTYSKTIGNQKYMYALNLGLEDALRWYDDGSGHYDRVYTDGLLSRNEQRKIISSTISDDLMVNLWDIRGGANVNNTLLVPSDMTTWTNTNPISSTSVIAYVDGIDLGANTRLSSFGIGGSRIVHEAFVVCYVKNGKKLYTYVDNKPAGVPIIESFTNATRAAEAGYMFDMSYFK